jgi:hypothetical protein
LYISTKYKVKKCAAANPLFGYGVVSVLLDVDFYAVVSVQRLVPTTVGEYLKWYTPINTPRHPSPVDKYGLFQHIPLLYYIYL